MATILQESPVVVRRRPIAPGEIELACVAALQFFASLALFFAPVSLLAGNGTALLTAASTPSVTPFLKVGWALVFALAGYLAVKAIQHPSIKNRRVAWQVVIPLWAAWWVGLAFPLVVGRETNIIVLAAVFFLINQWILTRMFIPANSSWYEREFVMVDRRHHDLPVDFERRAIDL